MLDIKVTYHVENGKSHLLLFCPEAGEDNKLIIQAEKLEKKDALLETYWKNRHKIEKEFLKVIVLRAKQGAKCRAAIRKKQAEIKRKKYVYSKKSGSDQEEVV